MKKKDVDHAARFTDTMQAQTPLIFAYEKIAFCKDINRAFRTRKCSSFSIFSPFSD